MPASKRRRAWERNLAAARAAAAAQPEAQPAPAEAEVATPAPAVVTRRRWLERRPPGDTPVARPARAARAPAAPLAVEDQPWGRLPLLVLLGLVFVVEILIGLVTHFIYHRNRLILVDLFFFNAVLALPAAPVLAPVVKRLMHVHRNLRFAESLSLGAVYALVVTLVTLTFLHPTNLPANATADQLIDSLRIGDIPGIALADVLGLVVTVQLFPGVSRMLSAPGRRARQRLEARGGQPARGRRGDTSAKGGKPRRDR